MTHRREPRSGCRRLAGSAALLVVLALSIPSATREATAQPGHVRPSREALREKARLNPVRVHVGVRVPQWAYPNLWPTDEQWKALYAAKQRVVDRVVPLGATEIMDTGPLTLRMLAPLAALDELLAHPEVAGVAEQIGGTTAAERP